jgi:hypothetical protein
MLRTRELNVRINKMKYKPPLKINILLRVFLIILISLTAAPIAYFFNPPSRSSWTSLTINNHIIYQNQFYAYLFANISILLIGISAGLLYFNIKYSLSFIGISTLSLFIPLLVSGIIPFEIQDLGLFLIGALPFVLEYKRINSNTKVTLNSNSNKNASRDASHP